MSLEENILELYYNRHFKGELDPPYEKIDDEYKKAIIGTYGFAVFNLRQKIILATRAKNLKDCNPNLYKRLLNYLDGR